MAKCCRKSADNIDLGVYDYFEEVTAKEYNTIELPSEKIDGVWVKAENVPKVEYPEVEETEKPITEIEQLRADIDYLAIMTGVEL